MNRHNETFSAREYGQMLMCLGEARGNASLALRLYVQSRPNERHPANSRTITRAYQRVLENLPIVPRQEGAGSTISARSEQAILDVVRRNPRLGTRTAAKLVRRNNGPRVSHWAVHKVLRKDKQRPYRSSSEEDSSDDNLDDGGQSSLAEITNETLALNEPVGTKRRARKIPRSDVTSTRQHKQGDSSTTAGASSVRLAEELDDSSEEDSSDDNLDDGGQSTLAEIAQDEPEVETLVVKMEPPEHYKSGLLGESEVKAENIEIGEEGFS